MVVVQDVDLLRLILHLFLLTHRHQRVLIKLGLRECRLLTRSLTLILTLVAKRYRAHRLVFRFAF